MKPASGSLGIVRPLGTSRSWNSDSWVLCSCLGWLCREGGEGEKTSEGHIFPSQPPSPPCPSASFPFPTNLSSSGWAGAGLLCWTWGCARFTVRDICCWAWLCRKRLTCNQSVYGSGARVVEPVPLGAGRRTLATSFYCQEGAGRRAVHGHLRALSSPLSIMCIHPFAEFHRRATPVSR